MTHASADPRRALLVAALGFTRCPGVREARPFRGALRPDPRLGLLQRWLSTWSAIGLIAAGMARQGYDLSLARYAELGWRATFYVSGREHSPTGASGSAFELTPARAVQVAAWAALAGA